MRNKHGTDELIDSVPWFQLIEFLVPNTRVELTSGEIKLFMIVVAPLEQSRSLTTEHLDAVVPPQQKRVLQEVISHGNEQTHKSTQPNHLEVSDIQKMQLATESQETAFQVSREQPEIAPEDYEDGYFSDSTL